MIQKITLLLLAVLALFYFDALESDGNRNQFSFDGTHRSRSHIGGADVHRQIFSRSDRGQVNA